MNKHQIIILGLMAGLCGCATPPRAPLSGAAYRDSINASSDVVSAIKEDRAGLAGIPNFAVVDATRNILRGGEPDTNGFRYLAAHGITNIVKLNLESEGAGWKDEDWAIGHGGSTEGLAQARVTSFSASRTGPVFNISYLPITVEEQLIGPPKWVAHAVRQLQVDPGNYVHCLHGQDRTGLVVACYRVMVQHWTKADAEKEMLAHGFHKELHGLWEYWENFPNQAIWKQW